MRVGTDVTVEHGPPPPPGGFIIWPKAATANRERKTSLRTISAEFRVDANGGLGFTVHPRPESRGILLKCARTMPPKSGEMSQTFTPKDIKFQTWVEYGVLGTYGYRILKAYPQCRGKYLRFIPRLKDGTRKNLLVQYVVAEAFIGPKPHGMWVLHKDDNGHNNLASNLYYGSPSNNTYDIYRNGRLNRGTAHHRAKLNEDQVREILGGSDPLVPTAAKFKVSKKLVLLIRQRKIWRHITCPERLERDYARP